MADRSRIEWTDATWNPVRARNLATGKVGWHCVHLSEGCRSCYAETFNRRLGTGLGYVAQAGRQVEVFLDETTLAQPLRWKKPRRIFVGSMTDLFADFVTDAMLDRIFAVMALAPQHTFQLLTKRSARMRAYLAPHNQARADRWGAAVLELGYKGPLECLDNRNVWLGVSVEDQAAADERVPDLLATPATIRDGRADELLEGLGAGVLDHAGDDARDALIALPLHGADHDVLAGALAAHALTALVPMAVVILAADVGLINLHNAHKLLKLLVSQPGADAVAHMPSGAVGAEPHHTLNLERRDALLAGHHHVDDAKPLPERLVRVLEDCPSDDAETVAGRAARRADRALPVEGARRERVHLHGAAARAANAVGPAVRHQVGRAGVFVREGSLKLRDRHLVNVGHRALSPAAIGEWPMADLMSRSAQSPPTDRRGLS